MMSPLLILVALIFMIVSSRLGYPLAANKVGWGSFLFAGDFAPARLPSFTEGWQ
jgi:hypothetical protein